MFNKIRNMLINLLKIKNISNNKNENLTETSKDSDEFNDEDIEVLKKELKEKGQALDKYLESLAEEKIIRDEIESEILGDFSSKYSENYLPKPNPNASKFADPLPNPQFEQTQKAKQFIGEDEYNRRINAEMVKTLKKTPRTSGIICKWR